MNKASKALPTALGAILLGFLTLFALAAAFPETAAPGRASAAGASAQETFSGEWTAQLKREKAEERINFSFRIGTGHDKELFSGSDYSLDEFEGLTREQVLAQTDTPVSFRLVREAGTIECKGSFRNGKGAGTWVLTPSQSFKSGMNSRGFGDLTGRQMLTSALLNLTLSFVDDLKSSGFERLSFDDAVKALIFKVTPQFIAEMKSLGFDNLGLEDLVKARIFKLDAEFAREVKAMGFDAKSMEEMVKLRIFKITPDFIQEMKAEGLSPDSVEDLVKLRIFNIDSDFIRRAKASANRDLSIEQLVELRIHGKVK